MRRLVLSLCVIQSVFHLSCLALLEESFIAFQPSAGGLDITNAPILYSSDDFVGVGIAAESLATDYSEITGTKPTTIIVGSLNSSLIQRLSRNGTNSTLNVQDIAGKWETFKTSIVSNPMPGIQNALVIVGSDKRGAIFGIYTLAEQSGQSP
jgi:hypothetical protein